MGNVEQPAQTMRHGVAQPQPCLGKGNARHGRRLMHFQPHVLPPRIGGREGGKGAAERLPGVQIRHRPRVFCRVGFHRVAQGVEPRLGDQPLGQLLQKVAVQNRRIGAQTLVHQRVLDLVVGQDGKIRHLRAGAGGRGDGDQLVVSLREIGHGLGAVHGAAPAQRYQQIGGEFLQPRRPLRRQLHRGVGLHLIKILHLSALCRLGDPLRRAVFHEKRVRHQHQPLAAHPRQRRNRTGAGIDRGLTLKLLHKYAPPFQR